MNYTGNQQLDRFQRIDALPRLEDGFLPTTLPEQTEVLSLQSFIDRPGGAARHLAEVVKHQRKADTDDPQAAARRITRDYINYAQDAKARFYELEALGDELEDANPELILDRVVTATQPGVLAFMRYFDLSTLRHTGNIRAVGYDPQKTKYLPDNGGIVAHAEMAVESWRVHQVRKRLPEAKQDQANRTGFFLKRLVEVKDHYPILRPIAAEGLDQIYERVPAS
jgi:hypothetical protein